jgi:hypothetical protein
MEDTEDRWDTTTPTSDVTPGLMDWLYESKGVSTGLKYFPGENYGESYKEETSIKFGVETENGKSTSTNMIILKHLLK